MMVEERLQKIIAQAGLASRRQAEKMILAGRVSINNQVVKLLGSKVNIEKDEIRVDGMLIYADLEKVYVMLNKPSGYVTTLRDPQNRPIVSDLLPTDVVRVFPAGRLDYDSQGLLLLTNDGDLAQRLIHPRFRIPKVYYVKIKGRLSHSEFRALQAGIELDDGIFKFEDVRIAKANEKSTWLAITLRSGKNRIIRRVFEALGHDVAELVRTRIGDLELGNLKTGAHRFLTKAEIKKLFSFAK
jgi:23S rRNA pseudouridine2605 synthase